MMKWVFGYKRLMGLMILTHIITFGIDLSDVCSDSWSNRGQTHDLGVFGCSLIDFILGLLFLFDV